MFYYYILCDELMLILDCLFAVFIGFCVPKRGDIICIMDRFELIAQQLYIFYFLFNLYIKIPNIFFN